jgi:hypothetical protein
VEASNRALRLAQLARHVSASLHRRHLARFSEAALLALTERVHAKLPEVAGRSVWSAIRASSLPVAVTSAAFRRLTRPRGPVVAAAVRDQALRALAVERLSVGADGLSASWVLDYAAPDGVHGIGSAAAAMVDDALAARIRPGTDAATLLQSWQADLARPSAADRLTPAALERVRLPQVVDLRQGLLPALADRVLGTMPSARRMEGEREAALTGAAHAAMLQMLGDLAHAAGRQDVPVRLSDAKRLGLTQVERTEDPARVLASVESLRALLGQVRQFARSHRVAVPAEELQRGAERMRTLAMTSMRVDGPKLVDALRALSAKLVQ